MIYIDLDDVTADFVGYTNMVLGTKYKVGDILADRDWDELRRDHQHLFNDLLPNQDFVPVLEYLLSQVQQTEVAFLSALPYDEKGCWQYAAMHKVQWVFNYLKTQLNPYDGPYNIPLFFGPYAHDKHKHCKVGDILIDDRFSNCEEWIAAGGVAHLYRNAEECMQFLKENL
jgi:hypothetical protein